MSKNAKTSEIKVEVSKDIEELKEVFKAISEFIRDIQKPLSDLIGVVLSFLEGSKVGKDIASFYSQLKEKGLPNELIENLTLRYAESRISLMKTLGELAKYLKGTKLIEGEAEKEKEVEEKHE